MEIHPKDKRKFPTILIAVTLIGQLHDDVILLLLQRAHERFCFYLNEHKKLKPSLPRKRS